MDVIGGFISSLKPRYEDDIIDRLNYYWTVVILLFFGVTLSAKNYVGEPLQCWVPAEFKGGWEQYAENYCFVENTYYARLDENLGPDMPEKKGERMLNYYQWVPFVLALQALLFHLPNIIWRMMNWQSGLNVKQIVKMAMSSDIDGTKRDGDVKIVANHISDVVSLSQSFGQFNPNPVQYAMTCGQVNGIYVSIVYILTKFLYLVNIICQFAIMNSLIGSKYTFWGAEILKQLANGQDWTENAHFPRVTFCDFSVLKLGNQMHPHTIQCVLMINMFNEKIFVFLWWWFVFVAILTVLNTVWWIYVTVFSFTKTSFIQKYLKAKRIQASSSEISQFVNTRLRTDGVFVLRIISNNAGDMIVTQLVKNIWEEYQKDNNRRPSYRNAPPLPAKAAAV